MDCITSSLFHLLYLHVITSENIYKEATYVVDGPVIWIQSLPQFSSSDSECAVTSDFVTPHYTFWTELGSTKAFVLNDSCIMVNLGLINQG